MASEYKDYYKILGVDKNTDEKDIKSAYRKLARKHHPDVNQNDKQKSSLPPLPFVLPPPSGTHASSDDDSESEGEDNVPTVDMNPFRMAGPLPFIKKNIERLETYIGKQPDQK